MEQPDEWGSVYDAILDDDALAEALDEQSAQVLDDEFPLGDGVADLASVVNCPYCGESVEITLDPGSGGQQDYVEDCSVCCRPWNVSVTYLADGTATVFVEASDDQ